MKRLLLIFCCLPFHTLFAQKIHTSVKGGINVSFSLIETENIDVKPCFNLGYTLGFAGRIDTKKEFTVKWAKWKNKNRLFLESGLNLIYQGTSYKYDSRLAAYHNYHRLELPLLLVIKSSNRYAKRLRRKNWFPITKMGMTLSVRQPVNRSNGWQKDNLLVTTTENRINAVNPGFIAGVGYQKEYEDGSILYFGYLWLVSFKTISEGDFVFEENNNAIATGTFLNKGHYLAIETQYFFGNKDHEKTIYNPRLIY